MAKKLCWMHPPPMEPPPSPPGRGAIQQQVHYTCYLLDGDGMSNTMLLLGEDLLAIQARKDRKGMSSITRYVLPAPSPKSPAPGSASFGFGLLEDIPLGTSLTHEALVAPAMNERVSVWDTVIAGAPGAVVDVGPVLLVEVGRCGAGYTRQLLARIGRCRQKGAVRAGLLSSVITTFCVRLHSDQKQSCSQIGRADSATMTLTAAGSGWCVLGYSRHDCKFFQD